ncbi:hypothetical protein [Streptomyces sp. NPDC003401]
MLWVAVLLLPALSVLLVVMDRVEDRMPARARPGRRHAGRRRHLHLVRGASRGPGPAAHKGARKGARRGADGSVAGPRAA